MKGFSSLTAIALLVLAGFWSFEGLTPTYRGDISSPETYFSTDKALAHVKNIAKKPHGVGFPGHEDVQAYIINELDKLRLETVLQTGEIISDSGNLTSPTNIVARIKGAENGKALVLLSHYDSSPHSSLGASDAGSGVATILEGLRAFLVENKTPKNDIIIMFSDAEEVGLNGAELFVKEHPWRKNIGLVLNFEARGSGGPSYMFIETNRGNARLIEEFIKANPHYPVSNSLAYDIYKILPNATDLIVFREDGDIEGFNFAFIGDPFDYHSTNDNFERLDRNSLAHQGSYIMALLEHFSEADLSALKSLNDAIYFNIPFFKLVAYPSEWTWPIFGLGVVLFMVLLIHGFRRKKLHLSTISKGFLPLAIILLVNGIIGYFSWSFLKWTYPQYEDMLLGFPYNGYLYIAACILLALGICFFTYQKFKKIGPSDLVVAPIFLWIISCACITIYVPGAGFLSILTLCLLASFWVILNQKVPSAYLMVFLALPIIFILVPFLKIIPVALGLKLLFGTTLLTSLIFALLLPIFNFMIGKRTLAFLCFIGFFGCMIVAQFDSGFSKDRAKPTSLVYLRNANTGKTQWATYEKFLSPWTAQYIDASKKAPETDENRVISSIYRSNFTAIAEAPQKEIPAMAIEKNRDTIIGQYRYLDICITPKRAINRLDVYTNTIVLEKATVNGLPLSDYYLKNRRKGKLVTHYLSTINYTDLELVLPKAAILELRFFEISNNLLTHDQFSIPSRPENNIPMPFIVNDAILVTKTVRYE